MADLNEKQFGKHRGDPHPTEKQGHLYSVARGKHSAQQGRRVPPDRKRLDTEYLKNRGWDH